MDFKEKLVEILGEENSDKIENINKALPEFFIPKGVYNEMAKRTKIAESKVEELAIEVDSTKSSTLTEQEKLQKEIEKALKSQSDYQKKSNRLEAQQILVNSGLKEEDYSEFIDGLVYEDVEATKKYATALANTLTKQKTNFEKEFKSKTLQETPRPEGSQGDPTPEITKETLATMPYSEQMKFQQANPTKFNELFNS